MLSKRLGVQQKKILELLTAYPNSTIVDIGRLLRGKLIIPGGKEYNSICRSLHILETNGLVEKEGGQIKWHTIKKAQ